MGRNRVTYNSESRSFTVPEYLGHLSFQVTGNDIIISGASGYTVSVNEQEIIARGTEWANLRQPLHISSTVSESYYANALVPVIAWVDRADGSSRFLTEAEVQAVYPAESRPDRGRLDSWLGKIIVVTHGAHSPAHTIKMPAEMSLGNGRRGKPGRPRTQKIGAAQVEVAAEYLLGQPVILQRVLGDISFFGKFQALFAH